MQCTYAYTCVGICHVTVANICQKHGLYTLAHEPAGRALGPASRGFCLVLMTRSPRAPPDFLRIWGHESRFMVQGLRSTGR